MVNVLICLIYCAKWYREDKKSALVAGEIIYSPKIPEWTLRTSRIVQFNRGLRFECKEFTRQLHTGRYGNREDSQGAVDWVRARLNQRYRENEDNPSAPTVPNTVRIISVPMKNFKCGTSCTDFQPQSGMAPGAYRTYQMCGKEKIQVTRYVENDVSYVAGYCVYIEEPYESSMGYEKVHIDHCYDGPTYRLRRVAAPEPRPPTAEPVNEMELEENSRNTSKVLKVSYCERLKQPVMIGLQEGVVKHFEWQSSSKSYKIENCLGCNLEKWEDNPPPYHLLDV